MKQHMEWLNTYISQRLEDAQDPSPLELKRIHTGRVYENARLIATEELARAELVRASLLGALFHDIARFDQYRIYGTFKDAESINHGLEGVRILKRHQRFKDEEAQVSRLALTAVGLHNRRQVPEILASSARAPVNVVRDADKLDILRVLDEHLAKKPYSPTVILGLPDEPDLCNPKVVQAAMNGQCASYGALWSVNDFRVLLGSWFFSMNFAASRKLFISGGHALNLVQALPQSGHYAKVRTYLLKTYEKWKKELNVC